MKPHAHHTSHSRAAHPHTEPEHGAPLLGPGTRAFDLPVRVGDADWAKKVVVGDFTGDGKPDFATLHWETDGRCVVAGVNYRKGFLVIPHVNTTPPGTSPATFTAMPGLEVINDDYRIYPMYPSDIAVGDVNGNGTDDIVVACSHHDQIYVYLSNGDGTFQPPLVIPKTGHDDPCYIALGDFNADGKLDIAVVNLRRSFPGQNFECRPAFLFGNGDGTFQDPIVLDQGSWSFGGDHDDAGAYYKSTTFNVITMKKSVLVGGAHRDAVSLNGVMMWWDGTAIQITRNATSEIKAPVGTTNMEHYRPGSDDFAAFGGRNFLASEKLPGDTLRSAANTEFLDLALRGRTGGPITGDFSGTHVIVADFDGDGLLDVLLFSDTLEDTSYVEREMFMIYGQSELFHPMSLAGPAPVADLDRLKFFPNDAGSWYVGHRGWRAAVADFDGDGFPDILTLTPGGVLLHTNFGRRPYQGARPTIQQIFDTTPHTLGGSSVAWLGDQMNVIFRLGDARPATGVVFHSVFPGGPVVFLRLTLDARNPTTQGSFPIPDDNALPPGDYDVKLHNGIVESANSLRVKIALRPVEIDSLVLAPLAKGQSTATILLRGFFGVAEELPAQVSFTIEETGKPATAKALSIGMLTEMAAKLSLPLTTNPGAHTVTAIHRKRGRSQLSVTVPDYHPRLIQVAWINPGGRSGGLLVPGHAMSGVNPQPGATIIFAASMLHAPTTMTWKLFQGGVFLDLEHNGSLHPVNFKDDNDRSGCQFILPATIKPGKDYHLGVTTLAGLDSDLAGPLTIDAVPTTTTPPPAMPVVWVAIEDLQHGRTGHCETRGYVYPTTKYDETDPKKESGALQKAKAEFPAGYLFGPLTPEESEYSAAGGSLCEDRIWNVTGTSKATGMSVTVEAAAITAVRAIINATDEYDLELGATAVKKNLRP